MVTEPVVTAAGSSWHPEAHMDCTPNMFQSSLLLHTPTASSPAFSPAELATHLVFKKRLHKPNTLVCIPTIATMAAQCAR